MTWKIATRYFRGKGTANAVPLLSRISMVAIAVCSAAMIIVLSVFNGLDAIVKQQYKSFCPNLKVSLVRGKFFPESAIDLQALRQMNGVVNLTPVIEDNALAGDDNGLTGSGQQQKVVSVKGVENNYFNVTDVAGGIIEGVDTVSAGKPYTCIMGRGVADGLRSGTEGAFNYISLYYANPELADPESDPLNALTVLTLHPAGVFELDAEFDDRYVFAPLPLVQELLHAKGKYSAIEIRTDSTRIGEVKKLVQQQVGDAYKVEDINDQNKNLFAMMGGEKYIVYMILLFVLVIASFNMVGALSVLVVTKQKDVAILRAMGASTPLIRNVFMMEGVLWSLAGGIAGITLGIIICLLQQHYGLLKMQASFSVDAFPVRIIYTDAILVIITIIVIGLAAAVYPAVKAARLSGLNLKSD